MVEKILFKLFEFKKIATNSRNMETIKAHAIRSKTKNPVLFGIGFEYYLDSEIEDSTNLNEFRMTKLKNLYLHQKLLNTPQHV
jgi:hypothetical protein